MAQNQKEAAVTSVTAASTLVPRGGKYLLHDGSVRSASGSSFW